ncbi:hypothetical protein [Luteolibacter sp. LG18]|uniref:hypothetical protein n=1 Tax=Luteolibacter sp. LG18 TaxID=2819286 RepID=UPI002B2FAA60|nr:hypothetical protein llg_26780 [Luteolibacter sp. LG18]
MSEHTTTTEAVGPPPFQADGSFSKNWHAALGEEFAPHAAQLGTFKNVAGLAKSYLHLRSTGPAYPGEQSTPEEVARFQALAKVPKEGTAAAYGLKVPELATEKDRAVYERMAQVAHAHHLPGPGFAALVAEYSKLQGEQVQALVDGQAQRQREAQDALVREWRGEFEANSSMARHYTAKLAQAAGIGPEDPVVQELANMPAFAKMMLQVARMTSEDAVRAPAGHGNALSPRQQAEEIMAGRDPVWGMRYRNGDRDAMLQVSNLLEESTRI